MEINLWHIEPSQSAHKPSGVMWRQPLRITTKTTKIIETGPKPVSIFHKNGYRGKHTMNQIKLFLLSGLVLLLYGCTSSPGIPTITSYGGYPLATKEVIQNSYPYWNETQDVDTTISSPTPSIPEAEKASISGVLYQISQSSLLKNFVVYLTPAQGENHDQPPPILAGPLADKGDIPSRTNEKGEFQFNNVPPGRYFLVVAFGYDYDIVIVSENNPVPFLIELKPNERKTLGTVFVP